MPDRAINFGESETEATYQIQDTDAVNGGGNFVVAKDTNANTVLLEYQPGSDTWQYAGDVDMGGGDITNVNGLTASSAIIGGTLTATDVNTDSVNTGTLDLETISTKTGSQIQYTSGVGGGQTYMLTIDTNTGGDIQMTFNGDDASGAYEYWTIDGTRQTNEDVITLADTAGFTRISGYVIISASRFGSGPAFSSNITPGRMNNVVNVASKGGTQGTVALDSIEVDAGPQSNESSLIRITQV